MTALRLFQERLLSRLELAQRQSGNRRLTLSLADDQVVQLAEYFDLLCRWNKKINLTALPLDILEDHAVDRLFVEPLRAVEFIDRPALPWADLGSGGGSPAVPLRIACPTTLVTMVESKSRKAAFLREVVRQLALSNVAVLTARADGLLPAAAGKFEAVTVRAVRVDNQLLNSAHQLLGPEGLLLVFTGDVVKGTYAGFDVRERIPLPNTGRLVVLRSRREVE